MSNTSLKDWFFEIPIITRFLFVASFAVSLGGAYGAVNSSKLLLIWPMVYHKFELWRLVTNFFFHRVGFPFLMLMMFLYNQSKQLESTEYQGRTSDYLFFILFCAAVLLPVSYFMKFVVLGRALVMSIIYMWSRKFPTMQMSFYFGIQFQGMYLPWVLCAFELLLGGVPFQYLAGIFAAHVFYYLTEVMPRVTGKPSFIQTPAFMYRMLPPEYNLRVGGQYVQQRQNQAFRGNARRLDE